MVSSLDAGARPQQEGQLANRKIREVLADHLKRQYCHGAIDLGGAKQDRQRLATVGHAPFDKAIGYRQRSLKPASSMDLPFIEGLAAVFERGIIDRPTALKIATLE
jgi:hypothetical protein